MCCFSTEGLDALLGCHPDKVHSVLSSDGRVRYMQSLVFNLRSALGMYNAHNTNTTADPLEFIRLGMGNPQSATKLQIKCITP